MSLPKPPNPSIFSWLDRCEEVDANYWRGATNPWIYEFSNGRRFVQPTNPYYPYPPVLLAEGTREFLLSEDGNILMPEGST